MVFVNAIGDGLISLNPFKPRRTGYSKNNVAVIPVILSKRLTG